ncbi:hypothetical protein GSI_03092 [Ganoderma sinense ZZ0214-1]|uniref:Uncharacterized protein n=1 Tax=Ganoderma sinense ZZ0214-1 TaxID=1077348 RepID=A0A2G8SKP0_9APHY|nr:hypothetical protein GSI_03092 [Ganoderma sinense ZZ0214-1]
MKDDERVYSLVRQATPPRYRIRDEVDVCAVSGRKHTHKIVMGGPGTQKQDIGLILSVCPNPHSSRCARHLKPLKLQMSLTTRLGLLLDLAALQPPPFESEMFARWCCQATISLLARDTAALQEGPALGPGVFAAFTVNIPGLEDLPRFSDDVDAGNLMVRTRAQPTVVVADGEEVDVVLVIYEIDRIGPYRVVAKGKKLGALVGFTFRQPAVIRALGLAPNSRQLSSYLMYEPFQQAWTKAVQPCQTVMVCEGGGAIYRHPRVNVTLWLDEYVKYIYPDWVRQGLALHDLAAVAAENGGAAGLVARGGRGEAAPAPRSAAVNAKRPLLALPAPGPSDKSKCSLLALPAPAPSVKPKRPLLALPTPIAKPKCATFALSVSKAEKTQDRETAPNTNAGLATARLRSGNSATAPTIIDLTAMDTIHLKTCKCKRSLEHPEPLVKVTIEHQESGPRRRRQRRLQVAVKLEGKGTEREPYVL